MSNASLSSNQHQTAKQPNFVPLLSNNADEIFWNRQMKEHADVLSNLIDFSNDIIFKDVYINDHESSFDYLNTLKDYNSLDKFSLDDVNNFITLKNVIILHLVDNTLKPIPNFVDLFPAEDTKPREDLIKLISHMIKEETYYFNLSKGFITAEEEIKFWLNENSEHTEFSIKLINPQLKSKDSETLMLSINVKKEEKKQDNMPNIKQTSDVLNKSNDAAKINYTSLVELNSLDLKLAMFAHEIRETEHAQKRLSLINSLYL
jgi:hypothetical protein